MENSKPKTSVPTTTFDIQGNPVDVSGTRVVDVNAIIPADVQGTIQVGETGLKPILEKGVDITDDDKPNEEKK